MVKIQSHQSSLASCAVASASSEQLQRVSGWRSSGGLPARRIYSWYLRSNPATQHSEQRPSHGRIVNLPALNLETQRIRHRHRQLYMIGLKGQVALMFGLAYAFTAGRTGHAQSDSQPERVLVERDGIPDLICAQYVLPLCD